MKTVYRHYRVKRIVHGIAHITGGGLIDNPPRILPEGSASGSSGTGTSPGLPLAPVDRQVPDARDVPRFNMGIGLVLIVAEYYAEAITRYLRTEVDLPAWVSARLSTAIRRSSGRSRWRSLAS